jgi:hypothetical protein
MVQRKGFASYRIRALSADPKARSRNRCNKGKGRSMEDRLVLILPNLNPNRGSNRQGALHASLVKGKPEIASTVGKSLAQILAAVSTALRR